MDGTDSLWVAHSFTDEILNIQGVAFALITLCMLAVLWQRIRDEDAQTPAKKMVVMIGFGLITAVSLGIYISSWGWDRVLLAFGFSLATALSFFRPAFSICYFLAILLLRPWEVMEPNPLMLAMPKYWAYVSIGTWAVSRIFKKSISVYWDWLCTVFVIFCAWVFLSLFKAPNFPDALSHYMETFFRSVAIFFLTLNLLEDELDLLAFRSTLILGIVALGFIGAYRTLFDPTIQSGSNRLQSYGLLGDPNYLSAILLIAMPFVARTVFKRGNHWFYRLLGGVSLAIIIVVIALSRSRGALLSVLVLGAFYLILQIRSKTVALVLGGGLVSALIPLTALLGRGSEDLSSSSSSRISYWIAGWKMAIHNPLLGVGFDRYKNSYDSFAPSGVVEWGERTAHSSWFLVLAEAGFPGLILFIVVYGLVVRMAWKMRETQPELLFSVVGYAIAISFLSHTYLIYPYILFAFVCVSARLQQAQKIKEII